MKKQLVDWVGFFISIIWALVGPVLIIVFWVEGTLSFYSLRLYVPLILLISFIAFVWRRMILYNRLEKLTRELRLLQIKDIELKRKIVKHKIHNLQEELEDIQRRDYDKMITDISIAMLQNELEIRKSPNKVS